MEKLNKITFGLEVTFTISNWWSEPGFTHESDTPLKREKMKSLALHLTKITGGSFKETLDIYNHLQYETFLKNGEKSFVVTMDPGSIEVKTPPVTANELSELLKPLFLAAKNAEIYPYRNWWYGIKGGTEGGCHINMGGKTKEENIFFNEPILLLKYFSLLHNHPYLHYPFMGVDVGPGGNAQRMDEKNDFTKIKNRFTKAQGLHEKGELDFKKLWELFKDTSLITEKSSAPSLAKLTEPNYVLEDRAQEAIREESEAFLIASLKLKLLEASSFISKIELASFGKKLHQELLTSFYLWGKFQNYLNSINLNPVPYQIFFDRQFPLIFHGENVPKRIKIKEGRRPRVILSEKKRNGIVVSKTIDPSYKRFEFYFIKDPAEEELLFKFTGEGFQNKPKLYKHEGYLNFGEIGEAYYTYIDLKVDEKKPILKVKLIQKKDKKLIEEASFHLLNMGWI